MLKNTIVDINKLKGVEGFLRFLCIYLLVFNPLGTLLFLVPLSRINLLSLTMADVHMIIVAGFKVIISVLGVIGGFKFRKKDKSGISFATFYFALTIGINGFMIVAALLLNQMSNVASQSILSISVSIAWLIYLYTSERVKQTYAGE